MRVLLNMGKAEVELLQGSQDNPANLKPLARFLVGGLWISYRMTHTGWPNAVVHTIHFFIGTDCQPIMVSWRKGSYSATLRS